MLGRIGAGKDEQASRVQKIIPYSSVISPGQSLRQLKAGACQYDDFSQRDEILQVLHQMDKGRLLPAPLVVSLTRFEIARELKEGKDTFLITGMPATLEYLKEVDAWMSRGEFEPTYILYNVSPEVAEGRLKNRIEEGLRRGNGRSDDTSEEATRERQRIDREESQPVIDELRRRGVLHVINADGKRDEVQEQTQELLTSLHLIPREIATWQRPMAFRI